MAGTSVYDAIVKFVGDYADLKTGLPNAANAAAAAAGTSAGGIFGGTFGGVLKTTVGALAGAGVGLLLKAVTQGAVELDAATRKYQADTGATMEQTKLAGAQINALFRSNVDSYATVGAVLSKLATDLHITGDAAQATAQEFLNFAHATGQEPVAATDALTQAIKAFGLTAAQIPAFMNVLVASSQQYGTAVNEDVAALIAMAPALAAMNMGADQGIALLNMFAAAGVNAAAAPVALAHAVKLLKPGQDLNDLIAQIDAIKDPTLRAQKAMEIFGKSGAVWAKVFKDGTVVLSDFNTTAAQNADATTKAADSIDQGFGNQVVIAFHNAEGAMSGFAQNAQPVVDVLDALGNMGVNILPMLGTAVGAAIPKLWGKLKSLLPGFAAEGTAEGVAMGEAAAIAEVAHESTGVAAGQAAVAAEATPAALAAGEALGTSVATGTGTGLLGTLRGLIPGILAAAFGGASIAGLSVDDVNKSADAFTRALMERQALGTGAAADYAKQWLTKNTIDSAVADQAAHWADSMVQAGAAVGPAVAKGIDQTGPTVMDALNALILKVQGQIATILNNAPVPVAKLLATFGTSLQGVWDAAHRQGHATGVESMLAMAQGIEQERSVPLDAFTTMLTMLKTALTPQAEAARLAGELTSKALVNGLKSKDPAVAAQAIATKEAILDRLAVIAKESGPIGKKAMDELAAGMKSKDIDIRTMAKSAHDVVIAELDKTAADAATAGSAAGGAYASAVGAKVQTALSAVIAAILANPGAYTDTTVHDSRLPVAPTVTNPRGMIPAASGMTYVARDMPVYVHQAEAILTVPQAQAWRAGSGGGGGGQQITIENVSIADAHDEFSLVQQLRFLAGVQA